MSVAHLSHNIYPLPAATLRKNMKEPYVWGNGKRSFVSMSSERQTEYGRSSYRLVREQRMMAKRKEQRAKRKEQRGKMKVKQSTCLLINQLVNSFFRYTQGTPRLLVN